MKDNTDAEEAEAVRLKGFVDVTHYYHVHLDSYQCAHRAFKLGIVCDDYIDSNGSSDYSDSLG